MNKFCYVGFGRTVFFLLITIFFTVPAKATDKAQAEAILRKILMCLKYDDIDCYISTRHSYDELTTLLRDSGGVSTGLIERAEEYEGGKAAVKQKHLRETIVEYLSARFRDEDSGISWTQLECKEIRLQEIKDKSAVLPKRAYFQAYALLKDLGSGETYVANIFIQVLYDKTTLFAISEIKSAQSMDAYVKQKEQEDEDLMYGVVEEAAGNIEKNTHYFNEIFTGTMGSDSVELVIRIKNEYNSNFVDKVYYRHINSTDTVYLSILRLSPISQYYNEVNGSVWCLSETAGQLNGYVVSSEANITHQLKMVKQKE